MLSHDNNNYYNGIDDNIKDGIDNTLICDDNYADWSLSSIGKLLNFKKINNQRFQG